MNSISVAEAHTIQSRRIENGLDFARKSMIDGKIRMTWYRSGHSVVMTFGGKCVFERSMGESLEFKMIREKEDYNKAI